MTKFPFAARVWALILAAIVLPSAISAAPFAAYVMDARTGKPIYTQNADTRLHPASLTKMMTLYMAFAAIEQGRVRLDSRFTVSSNAAAEPPSKLGLRAGQQIELRYLIRAAAIKSANDAATVIGEGLAGSEEAFAQQMTATARALGMRNSNFRNANGLTQEGHYSTAEDMTILGRRLFYDFPQYYNIFSRRSADAGIATVTSTNRRFLDDYSGADGIKTGYTRAAGFNLTASAQRGSKRIIASVFGGTSTAQRNQVMAQLLDAGFSRAPVRVREERPAPPQLLAQKVVRQAQVEPRQVAVAPQPERLVLNQSEPPRRASAAASTANVTPGRDQLAEAVAAAIAPTAQAATVAPTQLALSASARPPLRAGARTEAVEAAVEMAATTETAQPQTASIAGAVLASSSRPIPSPRARSAGGSPAVTTVASAEPAAAPAPAAASAEASLASSSAPKPRSDTVILAAMGEGDVAEPEAVEVVSRTGSRGWGVSLGLFNSKAEADKLLLQTILQGGDAMSGARTGVADTARGFEPRVAGLTEAAALAACDKLAARSHDCTVVRP